MTSTEPCTCPTGLQIAAAALEGNEIENRCAAHTLDGAADATAIAKQHARAAALRATVPDPDPDPDQANAPQSIAEVIRGEFTRPPTTDNGTDAA